MADSSHTRTLTSESQTPDTPNSGSRVQKRSTNVLQMHLTDRCNLRCSHCYQEGSISREMTAEQILSIIEQFHSISCIRGDKGRLSLTGGEPFVRHDFIAILKQVIARFPSLQVSILTNGTLITEGIARDIARAGQVGVQVSLDGAARTHDLIRGPGNHARALQGMKNLASYGIKPIVSFTAQRANLREFPAVVRAARQVGAKVVWTDRMVPTGKAQLCDVLNPSETREFFELVYQEKVLSERFGGGTTKVAMARSLQFLVGGGRPYHCSAGKHLLAVMPDGLVYPCRRLAIPLGNALLSPLSEIYDRANAFLERPNPCETCAHSRNCAGGARCLAYAATGNLLSRDPGCWFVEARQ